MCIDVVLSTYNGQKYLPELLDSILAQQQVDFRILVRDDGSADDTRLIIREYLERYPQIICFYDDGERLGVRGSFSRLSLLSDAPYIAFADQDDHWDPDKLRCLLDAIRQAEVRYGAGCPLLAHCDLRVVDQNMHLMANSFWNYQKLDVEINGLRRMLVSNTVTGCASMANRSLIRLAMPLPDTYILHDYWLAMMASCFGHILPVERSLVAYRQHHGNAVGAREINLISLVKRICQGKFRKDYTVAARSAQAMLDRYASLLNAQDTLLLREFSQIEQLGAWSRRSVLYRYRIGFSSWWKGVILFLRA